MLAPTTAGRKEGSGHDADQRTREAIGRGKRAVNAIWRMLQADEPSDYVLAAGEGDTVRVLRVAFSHVGLTRQDHLKYNESFERPAEVDALIGDATAARQSWPGRPGPTVGSSPGAWSGPTSTTCAASWP